MPQTSPPHPRQHASGTSGPVLWWVLAGVAAVAIVGMVTWLLIGNPSPPVPPTSPAPTTSTASSASTPPTEDPGNSPGQFSPTYELRDLSTLSFPDTYGQYEMLDSYAGDVLRNADYVHVEEPKTFSVDVVVGADGFPSLVEGLAEPALIGDAVCGFLKSDAQIRSCSMATTDGTLEVRSASDAMDVDELAEITQDFYAM